MFFFFSILSLSVLFFARVRVHKIMFQSVFVFLLRLVAMRNSILQKSLFYHPRRSKGCLIGSHWRWRKKVAINANHLRLARSLASGWEFFSVASGLIFAVYSLHMSRLFCFVFDKNHTKDTLNWAKSWSLCMRNGCLLFVSRRGYRLGRNFSAETSTKIHKTRRGDLHRCLRRDWTTFDNLI